MISIALGLPGSGKSTLLHQLVKAQFRVSVFLVDDHEAGWGPDSPLWSGPPPPITIIQGEDQAARLRERERPAFGIYVFRNVPAEKIQQIAVAWGDCTYVDDELDKAGRKKGFDDSALRAIINEGRHLPNAEDIPCEIHVLGACRRVQKLHLDITELADEIYIFSSHGARTMARLIDEGFIEEEDEAKVKALPQFALLHWPSRKWLQISPPASNHPLL